ncbi:MAG: alpha/beta hydrolase [Pseudomonadota bacterium]
MTRQGKQRLAYHTVRGHGDGANLPGLVFLGGFRSDMTGTKAAWLEMWAEERGRAFLRFDYSGHGESGGDFLDGCIGDWAEDAADAVEALTDGPQILIGSSMGGWIALLLAKRMPDRIAALVGIAAAPDFTEDSMWANFSSEQKAELDQTGSVALPSEYSDDPYVITKKLIEDGRQNLVLRSPLRLPFPLRLLQGTADTDVDTSVALRILHHVDCTDARLTLVKGSDHRFSETPDLTLLGKTLHGITQSISH